jgi:uncharacterized membrane protein YphA (DoxX/SURF4 family)
MQHLTSPELIIIVLLIIHVILFLQSGFDKIMNFKENLNWLNGHFANSFFKNQVRLLLIILTIMEVATGLTSIAAITALIFQGYSPIASLSMLWSLITLTSLFFGQRIAKDYEGAAALIPYIILSAATFVIINYFA